MIPKLPSDPRRTVTSPTSEPGQQPTTSKPKRLAAVISGLAMALSFVIVPMAASAPEAQAVGCEVSVETFKPNPVPAAAGTTTIRVGVTEGCTDWSVSSPYDSWIHGQYGGWLTTRGGFFDRDFTFDANPTNAERQATITATSSGMKSYLVIKQMPGSAAPYITIQDKLSVPSSGGTYCVAVQTNAPSFTATTNNSWLWPSLYGCGNNSISVWVERNTSDARTGSVTVEGSFPGYGYLTAKLTVAQDGTAPTPPATISLGSTEWAPPVGGGQTGFFVFTNQPTWTASSNQPWLTLNMYSGGPNQWVVATAAANPGASRTAVVTFKAGTATALYTVTQAGNSPGPGPVITVNPSTCSLTSGASSCTVTITTNQPMWTASTLDGWLRISPSSGVSGDRVTISAEANPGTTTRTGSITFWAGTAATVITATQAGGGVQPVISLDATVCRVSPERNTCTVTVSTNQSQWTASTAVTWMTISPASGVNGTRVTISIDANMSTMGRMADVTFTAGGATARLTVDQAGAVNGATLSISSASWNAKGEGDAAGLWVTTNQSTFAMTSSDSSWLTAENWPGSATYVVVYAKANPNTWPRTGTITFTAGSATPVTFTVTQAAGTVQPTLSIGRTTWDAEAAGGAAGFYVYTNQPGWTASADQSWLTVSKASGVTGDWLEVRAAANPSAVQRTGVVTVKAGTASATFSVTQKGGQVTPVITVDNTACNVGPDRGECSFTVTTNQATWTASADGSWFTLSPTSGVSGTRVTVAIGANTSTSARTGTITLSAGTATVRFTITQTGATPVNTNDDVPLAGNWTGRNGGATIGKYRPSTSTFMLRNSNTTGPADITVAFGQAGDKPVVGDWDGNGTWTIGVYRPSTGMFYLRNSNTPGEADITVRYGSTGDQPVAGDWTRTGRTSVGVYTNEGSMFHLRLNTTANSGELVFQYGDPYLSNTAVAGDWDGNGTYTPGVFLNSYSYYYLINTNQGGVADIGAWYGSVGNLPVVGDWDGNGTTTFGVFWASNGQFYLRNSNTGGVGDLNPVLQG